MYYQHSFLTVNALYISFTVQGPSEFTSLSCDTESDENHKKVTVSVDAEAATATATPNSLDRRAATYGCPIRQCRVRYELIVVG